MNDNHFSNKLFISHFSRQMWKFHEKIIYFISVTYVYVLFLHNHVWLYLLLLFKVQNCIDSKFSPSTYIYSFCIIISTPSWSFKIVFDLCWTHALKIIWIYYNNFIFFDFSVLRHKMYASWLFGKYLINCNQ